jgi:hypothetical protein
MLRKNKRREFWPYIFKAKKHFEEKVAFTKKVFGDKSSEFGV